MRISEWLWTKMVSWAYMMYAIRLIRFFTKMMRHFRISGQSGMRISAVFYKDVCRDMKQYEDIKGIKAKPDRPDAFTPVSCVPWVSFTAVGHDTPGPRQMYFPIIVFRTLS